MLSAKVKLTCSTCGVEFLRFRSNVRTKGCHSYCSVACVPHASCRRRHGMSNHPIHTAWMSMRERCYNPKAPAYSYYGARGIGVCDEWNSCFENFMRWAIDAGWRRGLSLDRINVNAGYSPENCRWATRQEQMINTRKRKSAKTSSFKGVSWCANVGKWRVQAGPVNGRPSHIGLFNDEIAAAKAYDRVIFRERGKIAVFNFPELIP